MSQASDSFRLGNIYLNVHTFVGNVKQWRCWCAFLKKKVSLHIFITPLHAFYTTCIFVVYQ